MSELSFHHVALEGEGRFELRDGEQVAGLMHYRRVDADTVNIDHTEVHDSHQGQGVGMQVLRAAVQWARDHHQRIYPTCPYARKKLLQHPELTDVVVGLMP